MKNILFRRTAAAMTPVIVSPVPSSYTERGALGLWPGGEAGYVEAVLVKPGLCVVGKITPGRGDTPPRACPLSRLCAVPALRRAGGGSVVLSERRALSSVWGMGGPYAAAVLWRVAALSAGGGSVRSRTP